MKTTFKHLEQFANSQGLTAKKYNAGDNLTIKILEGVNQDYFSGASLGRFKTINEAYAFVQGFLCAKDRMIRNAT